MTPLNPHVSRASTSILLLVAGAACTFALSACGSAQSGSQTHTSVVSVEAQFQPMVDAFTAEAQAQGNPVVITDLIVQSVQDLPSTDEMGVCSQGAGTTPTIQISQPLWDSLDANGQQELLFHELGHCVLNRVHETSENNGVPVSVMSPVFLGSDLYDANRTQYMHELFTGTNISSLSMVIPTNALLPDFAAAESNLSN
jgi:hypothetical protein